MSSLQSLRWKPNTLKLSWVSMLMVSTFLSFTFTCFKGYRWSCDWESESCSDLPLWLLRTCTGECLLFDITAAQHSSVIDWLVTSTDTVKKVVKKTWNDNFHELKRPGITCITVRSEGLGGYEEGSAHWSFVLEPDLKMGMEVLPCFPLFQLLYWILERFFLYLGK